MKDGTFSFRYYGCSLISSHHVGSWTLNADIIELYDSESDKPLDSDYYQIGNKLLATDTREEEFVLCDDYKPFSSVSENPN